MAGTTYLAAAGSIAGFATSTYWNLMQDISRRGARQFPRPSRSRLPLPSRRSHKGAYFNIVSAIKGRDFSFERPMFEPDPEYIPCGIDVPIMIGAAFGTYPGSYSERTHTFRTTVGDSPAARARPGTVSFADQMKGASPVL